VGKLVGTSVVGLVLGATDGSSVDGSVVGGFEGFVAVGLPLGSRVGLSVLGETVGGIESIRGQHFILRTRENPVDSLSYNPVMTNPIGHG